MRVKRNIALYIGLCLSCLCLLATSIAVGQQPPMIERQVGVITIKRHPARLGPVSMTVDVRVVVRDLYNETLYNKAADILSLSDNAYLSSNIVHLLKRAIDETYSETYNEELIQVRLRATSLLGLAQNPQAIPIITNLLQMIPALEFEI